MHLLKVVIVPGEHNETNANAPVFSWKFTLFFKTLNKFKNFSNDNDEIAFVTSKLWDGNLAETTHISSLGNIMYTSYFIWLIITSVILLLAMVGAIVITIKQKN